MSISDINPFNYTNSWLMYRNIFLRGLIIDLNIITQEQLKKFIANFDNFHPPERIAYFEKNIGKIVGDVPKDIYYDTLLWRMSSDFIIGYDLGLEKKGWSLAEIERETRTKVLHHVEERNEEGLNGYSMLSHELKCYKSYLEKKLFLIHDFGKHAVEIHKKGKKMTEMDYKEHIKTLKYEHGNCHAFLIKLRNIMARFFDFSKELIGIEFSKIKNSKGKESSQAVYMLYYFLDRYDATCKGKNNFLNKVNKARDIEQLPYTTYTCLTKRQLVEFIYILNTLAYADDSTTEKCKPKDIRSLRKYIKGFSQEKINKDFDDFEKKILSLSEEDFVNGIIKSRTGAGTDIELDFDINDKIYYEGLEDEIGDEIEELNQETTIDAKDEEIKKGEEMKTQDKETTEKAKRKERQPRDLNEEYIKKIIKATNKKYLRGVFLQLKDPKENKDKLIIGFSDISTSSDKFIVADFFQEEGYKAKPIIYGSLDLLIKSIYGNNKKSGVGELVILLEDVSNILNSEDCQRSFANILNISNFIMSNGYTYTTVENYITRRYPNKEKYTNAIEKPEKEKDEKGNEIEVDFKLKLNIDNINKEQYIKLFDPQTSIEIHKKIQKFNPQNGIRYCDLKRKEIIKKSDFKINNLRDFVMERIKIEDNKNSDSPQGKTKPSEPSNMIDVQEIYFSGIQALIESQEHTNKFRIAKNVIEQYQNKEITKEQLHFILDELDIKMPIGIK